MLEANTLQFQQSFQKIVQSTQKSLQKLENLGEPMETSMSGLKKSKKVEPIKEIPETLSKIEIKIPCLEVIKREPCCTNIFNELCPNEKKLNGDEKISVGGNVFVVLQKKLLPKTSTFNAQLVTLGLIIAW
ncbi:hypothetical protein G4B88_014132 [Cannabis sativa]|uniref:Uncharacterized protein n=1 Tax=Cannabis sativa TaxID=3483 RepID=A0A7J6I2M2_CANSA|nr:hypothetical protein G4B88_014132 [Cannabis sativa]